MLVPLFQIWLEDKTLGSRAPIQSGEKFTLMLICNQGIDFASKMTAHSFWNVSWEVHDEGDQFADDSQQPCVGSPAAQLRWEVWGLRKSAKVARLVMNILWK